jgi:hypothetical protein
MEQQHKKEKNGHHQEQVELRVYGKSPQHFKLKYLFSRQKLKKYEGCTEKKENQNFLISMEIQNGAVAKSYMS